MRAVGVIVGAFGVLGVVSGVGLALMSEGTAAERVSGAVVFGGGGLTLLAVGWRMLRRPRP